MPELEVKIEQRKGFYAIETPAGGKAKLDRVTTALEWVLKDATGAMSYYGGKLFARWLTDEGEDWEEHYKAWKASDFDPNKVLRARSTEGTAAHTLFGNLIDGTAKLFQRDEEWWVEPPEPDMPFVARGFDLGVIEAYLNVYAEADDAPLSEVRLWWTEHPIDDCPSHDKQGRCTHGFCGTCDVYFPHWGLDDLKTHVPGYRFSEYMQMAMYSLAAQQQHGAEIKRQRIVLAHDEPIDDEENPFHGKLYEVQDDRFVDPEAARLLWELYKHRKNWGPR